MLEHLTLADPMSYGPGPYGDGRAAWPMVSIMLNILGVE